MGPTEQNGDVKKTLLLVDGSALMHRAYHAMPGLTDRQGRPTGAVYGLVRMLLRAIKDLQPSHVAVAFDRKEPTFRKEMFIGYQAHRPEMDEELGDQFDRAREILQAMEIPIYDKAGFEADDVLGSIAEQVSSQESEFSSRKNKKMDSRLRGNDKGDRETGNWKLETGNLIDEVVILTGDKDLMQLVNEQVKLYLPVKGVSDAQLFGPSEVKEKLGVPPELVVDYKGLVGDPSDNYPGVKGIGPVTAVKLLGEYGGFEQIYKYLDKISNIKDQKHKSNSKNKKQGITETRKGDEIRKEEVLTESVRKKLIEGKEAGELSRELAEIKKDVELDFDLDDCEAVVKQPGRLARVLEEYGFQSLVKQLGLDEQTGGDQLRLV